MAITPYTPTSPPPSRGCPNPLPSMWHWIRETEIVDLGVVAVKGTLFRLFNYYENPDDRRTLKEKKQAIKLKALTEQAPPSLALLCRKTDAFVVTLLPVALVEGLPSALSYGVARYRFGLSPLTAYIDRQIRMRWGFEERALQTSWAETLRRLAMTGGANIIHSLATPSLIKTLFNPEYILMSIFSNALRGVDSQPHKHWRGVVLKRMAKSLSQQSKIPFCPELPPDWAMIARIEWHKTNEDPLPGLPDPAKVRLTPSNLEEELNKALTAYLRGHIKSALDEHPPEELNKWNLTGILYSLELKEMLVGGLTAFVRDIAIKQLTDPHLFAITILTALGKETIEEEEGGFGKDSRAKIAALATLMTEGYLNGHSASVLIEEFKDSKLRHAPGGSEGLRQKKETKELLRGELSKIIHALIKNGKEETPSKWKEWRERLSNTPLLGSATMVLNTLVNSSLYSWEYFKKEKKDPYLEGIISEMAGTKFADYLADRLVSLIYHPSWKITVLQLIDDLIAHGKEKKPLIPENNDTSEKDAQTIVQFLLYHFFSPPEENKKEPFSYFDPISLVTAPQTALLNALLSAGKDALPQLVRYVLNPESSVSRFSAHFLSGNLPNGTPNGVFSKGVESLSALVDENHLYMRVTDIFRRKGVLFEGDGKFWESAVREFLNQMVEMKVPEPPSGKLPPIALLFAYRERSVRELLKKNDRDLIACLSTVIKEAQKHQESKYEIIPRTAVN